MDVTLDCVKCNELNEKNKKCEFKCVVLESDIAKKNSEYEALDAKFRGLEAEKLATEQVLLELKDLQGGNHKVGGGGGGVSDLTQLRVKNGVLLWEKKKAETEVDVWMKKCKKLETEAVVLREICTDLRSRVLDLEKGLIGGSGQGKTTKMDSNELLGLTSDSDVEVDPNLKRGAPHDDSMGRYTRFGNGRSRSKTIEKWLHHGSNEEKDTIGVLEDYNYNVPFTPNSKKKRKSNVVTSDSEDDGNMAPPQRRRLSTFRQTESKNVRLKGIPTTEDFEDDESQEGSESDGSLKDFIVKTDSDDDVSHASPCASREAMDDTNSVGESDDVSDDDEGFGDILSRIKRTKVDKIKWEFEADMLAALGKEPELCMKAVCALHRQQTSEEQDFKESLCSNGRGFSKFDAYRLALTNYDLFSRGSTLARFLTNGDPLGDLKKSVEEFQKYDKRGVHDCRRRKLDESQITCTFDFVLVGSKELSVIKTLSVLCFGGVNLGEADLIADWLCDMDMKLNEAEMDHEHDVVVDDKDFKHCNEDCATCNELLEKYKKTQLRCVELEHEILNKNSEYEALEAKFRALEIEKLAIEDQLLGLKNKTTALDEIEDDAFTMLAIENHTLMCEKDWAYSQIEAWKRSCKLLELDKGLIMGNVSHEYVDSQYPTPALKEHHPSIGESFAKTLRVKARKEAED
ncbi:hypothetical protein ACFE04_009824 [Oxalis oulophora]